MNRKKESEQEQGNENNSVHKDDKNGSSDDTVKDMKNTFSVENSVEMQPEQVEGDLGITSAGEEEENKEEEEESGLEQELSPEDLAEKYKDQWMRVLAELDNYKKHVAKEKAINIQSVKDNLLYQLLPTVDHLELALKSGKEGANENSLVEGVHLILNGLYKYLEQFGVRRIESTGKPFDYTCQEAINYEETNDYPDNYVIKEIRSGYMINDKLLRAAQVILAKNTVNDKPSEDEEVKQDDQESSSTNDENFSS